jgi:hypothetical protein
LLVIYHEEEMLDSVGECKNCLTQDTHQNPDVAATAESHYFGAALEAEGRAEP